MYPSLSADCTVSTAANRWAVSVPSLVNTTLRSGQYFATSAAGSLRVEIQDLERKPIEGFRLADSVELVGDLVAQAVAWRGGTDLSRLSGKPVRLRFVLKDADLYSMQVR